MDKILVFVNCLVYNTSQSSSMPKDKTRKYRRHSPYRRSGSSSPAGSGTTSGTSDLQEGNDVLMYFSVVSILYFKSVYHSVGNR